MDSRSECYSLFSDVWSLFNQCEESNIKLLSADSNILNISKERSRGNITANNMRNNVFNSFFTSELCTGPWFLLSWNITENRVAQNFSNIVEILTGNIFSNFSVS